MQFILGNFGSGKTTHIIQQTIELIKANKKFLIIVPSRRHKDQLFLELLKQESGLIGAPIVTLTEFQKKLLEQLFPIPITRPQTISNFEKFLIISSIITQNIDNFQIFKNIQQRPEMIKMIYRLIHSLRDKDIETLKSSPELADKIHDIQLILSQYQQILTEKNMGDNKFEIDLICQNLPNISPEFFADHIFIDGFVDYTATQFKLIEHISRFVENHKKHIAISLTDIKHHICQQTILHFKDTFPHAECITLDEKLDSSLLANSFLEHTQIPKNSLDIYEIQAFGKNKEIEYVTNQIKKLCLIDNQKLEDILIITDQQDTYAPLLTSALRKANIPFGFGKDDKLSNNPLIIFIKRCLKIMTQELDHESIEFFALSNYVQDSIRITLGKAPGIIPLAIQGKDQSWKNGFQRQKTLLKEEDNDSSKEELELLENTIISLCNKLFSLDPYKNHSITTHINKLIDLLEFLGVQATLSQTHTLIKHKKIIDMSIAKDYSALLKLKEILQDLRKSLENIGHTELNLSSFLFFFGIITEETRYRSEIPQKNILNILSSKDARGTFAKSVFILGLNEGEFPAAPKFELFDNFDRNQLNILSQKILGLSLWRTDTDYFNEQQLSFATALTRSTEKIFFSRTPVNERGTYFNISHFLRRILEKDLNITHLPKPLSPIIKGQNPTIFSKKHSAEEYFELASLSLFKTNTNSSQSAIASFEYTQNIDNANKNFDQQKLPENHLLAYFGYIPTVKKVTQKYAADTVFVSPTRLEKLGRCRYQGLWQDFWKLKAHKLPVYKPEAADYGNLYHNVLELYIQETVDNKESEIFDEVLLHKYLNKCIEEAPQANVFKIDYNYIYTILKEYIINIEPQFRDQDKPLYFELSSGADELSYQTVSLNNNKSLNVFSRIDRVNFNTLNNNYAVIDYKKSGLSSYKSYQKTPFNLFQGFLYSELLRNNNKGPISAISYVFLEKQDVFQEFPGGSAKKTIYESIHDMQHFKCIEITRLLTLLEEGNFSPFTLESDIGNELTELFIDKFGDKFPRENETKCSYCDVQKLCLRQQKKIRAF